MKIEEKTMESKVTFYEETNFKNTEIGEIPADWEVVKLGNYVQLIRNGLTREQNTAGVGYPVSRIETISAGVINPNKVRYLSNLTDKEFEQYRIVKEDILFSHINSEPYLGNSAIYTGIPEILIHGMNLLLIRTQKDKLNSYFLNYLFNYFRGNGVFVSIASRAVNQSSINQGKIRNLPIPLPPLEEQKAIAYVLSTVQEAREKTEKVIEATKELKKSLMKHLFTYGPVSLEEASRINLKETEIGEIPADWEVVKLKDMASVVRGISWNRQEESRNGFGVPVLSIPNIKWGQVSFDFQHFLKGSIPPSKIIQKHDIIFVTSSGSLKNIGRNCLVTELPGNIPIAFASFLAVLRLKKNVNVQPDFLYYLINSHYVDFSKYTKRASDGKNNFQMKEFEEKVVLPLPPLPVQKRIAEILQTVDEKIQAEEKKKQALDNLFNSMLHMLMSGKLRVKFQTPEEGTSG